MRNSEYIKKVKQTNIGIKQEHGIIRDVKSRFRKYKYFVPIPWIC